VRDPSPTRPARNEPPPRGNWGQVKKILELLVCFLHPIAVVLGWVNLLGRGDLSGAVKLVWAIALIIPIVPFLYVLTGGDLW
jgi:hypothetical protein